MKQFKVTLTDGRCDFVVAEDWIVDDDKYLFTIDGKPRGDIFFEKRFVMGISVQQEDYDPPSTF